jgi:ABC-type glycerol-3-phosphate transport system substrate-binding protein
MKKIFLLCFVLAFLSAGLFAGGDKEEADLSVIKILRNIDPGDKEIQIVETLFHKRYPDVTVEYIPIDLSNGSTITIDSMIAQGNPPDIYMDFLGRASKYAMPGFAIELSDKIDLKEYFPDMINLMKRGNGVYGLPGFGGYQGMAVNLNILEEIGGTLPGPEGWKLSEFIELSEKAKNAGYYATGFFCGNQSGDYLYMNWFATFGAKLYNSDYTESLVDSPEGLETVTFWKEMHERGYIPKESAVLVDDDYVLQVTRGEILATGFYPAWMEPYFKAVEEQGYERFPYAFVAFPHKDGLPGTPACGSFPGYVAIDSGDKKKNEMIIYMLECMQAEPVQKYYVEVKAQYPTKRTVSFVNNDPYWQQINEIVKTNGYYDIGMALPVFSEIRKQIFPLNQELFNGKITPEELVQKYDEAVTVILQEE